MKLRKYILIISIIFIIIGISIKINKKYSYYLIENNNKKDVINFINNNLTKEYLAVLEIPKINIKQVIKETDNVDDGIVIINNSSISNSIVLAAHSGNCDVCYFNNLDKLKINDEIIYYSNEYKYLYNINYIDIKEKNTFKLDNKDNTITLITCKKDNDKYQLIIIGVLFSKIKY